MINLLSNAEPCKVAILDRCREYTYCDINTIVETIARNEKSRQLWVLICSNSLESICIYCACLKSGIIPILLDESLGDESIKKIVETYKPSVIWSPRMISNIKCEKNEKVMSYWKMTCQENEEYSGIHEDLGMLLATSGSTGSPKMVRISYKNIILNTESIIDYLGIDEKSRHITTLPMSYTYGLSCITTHLFAGGSIVLNKYNVIERGFWDTLDICKPTTMAGVPYTYEMLCRVGLEKLTTSSIRVYTQAGGALKANTRSLIGETLVKRGRKFWIMYGQTEATARMAYLSPDKFFEKEGSIGIPIKGGSFKIADGLSEGELMYNGGNVGMGYAQCSKDLGKGDEWNGILYTGDYANKDSEGYWYIIGRNKRFAKLHGKRINLQDVEVLIHKKGYDCICLEQEGKLAVIIEEQNSEHDINIKHLIAKHYAISANLISVKFQSDLPRNSNGKIDYSLL